jgi:molecular chaperone DnaK (HSP70)
MGSATIGIDFGTTNSAIGFARRSGQVELARFLHAGGPTDSYRSLLYLEQVKAQGVDTLKSWSGPSGI